MSAPGTVDRKLLRAVANREITYTDGYLRNGRPVSNQTHAQLDRLYHDGCLQFGNVRAERTAVSLTVTGQDALR